MSDEPVEKLWSLIEDIGVCMLTTRDGGILRSRPMVADVNKGTHEFRFITSLSSHKTDELAANPDVNIAFSDPDDDEYVSVSGQASLTQDRALIEELWNPYAEAWFKGGKDDPDIGVIRVVASKAEYWEGSNTLKQSWSLLKAVVGDSKPDLGENRKVSL